MKRLIGSTLIAAALVGLAVLLWRGQLGKFTMISSASATGSGTGWSSSWRDDAWGAIDVNWPLVLPLLLIAGIGTVLLLWHPRRLASSK